MASLLKLPSQAKVLSTRHLFLYSSVHLYRPLQLLRGGMQGPLMRSQPRKRSQSYALSATSLSGLFLGRPLLRGTRTRSKVSWASSTSRLERNVCQMRVHTPSSCHLFNLRLLGTPPLGGPGTNASFGPPCWRKLGVRVTTVILGDRALRRRRARGSSDRSRRRSLRGSCRPERGRRQRGARRPTNRLPRPRPGRSGSRGRGKTRWVVSSSRLCTDHKQGSPRPSRVPNGRGGGPPWSPSPLCLNHSRSSPPGTRASARR